MSSIIMLIIIGSLALLILFFLSVPAKSATYTPIDQIQLSEQIPHSPLTSTELMTTYMGMLEKHLPYAESQWHDNSSIISNSGYFGRGTCVEFGIRTTTYYTYVYAFLYKYSSSDSVNNYSKEYLLNRIIQSLRYLVATHKAINEGFCAQGNQWGLVWQSSLWTTRMGMASWLVWEELDPNLQNQVRQIITTEADFLLPQTPPHNLIGDTKAEENGWDSNVLSLATSMFPQDVRAELWDDKAKEFMMNTLSVSSDLLDPSFKDGKPISQWVHGPNLFPDFTSENHYFFHPVYMMVPIGELGNSAVTYAFGNKDIPESASHHVLDVWNSILKVIILADGEWFYPNGLDWMIHDYEHVSTLAWLTTYFDNSDTALMESRLVFYLGRRQNLQTDGSFFGSLNDVAELRESVQAARLVDSFFYHLFWGNVNGLTTDWESIEQTIVGTHYFPYSDVILHRTIDKTASFSWQNKLMGVITPESKNYLNDPYLTLPYQSGFVGNRVTSSLLNTQQVLTKTVQYENDFFTTTGAILEDEDAITHYLSFTSLPESGIVYLEKFIANEPISISGDFGMPIGIEMGGATASNRALYSTQESVIWDGLSDYKPIGNWINIDDRLGIVTDKSDLYLTQREQIRGAYQSILYGFYTDGLQVFNALDVVASRAALVMGNVNSTQTQFAASHFQNLTVNDGWMGVVVHDIEDNWLVLTNFYGSENSQMVITTTNGAPIVPGQTLINQNKLTYDLMLSRNNTELIPVAAFANCDQTIALKWSYGANLITINSVANQPVWCEFVFLEFAREIRGEAIIQPGVQYQLYNNGEAILLFENFTFLPWVFLK